MPYIRKVEYSLVGQVKLNGTNIELNRRNQCNGCQQCEIGYDEYFTGSIVPKFYEFYMK